MPRCSDSDGYGQGRGADGGRPPHQEPLLLIRPGNRMQHDRGRRDEGQRNHQADEQVIAAGFADRNGQPEIAERRRRQNEAGDEQEPTERAAREDEHPEGTDRIDGDPLRREGEPERYADGRHGQPEGQPSPAGCPRFPDHGEQDVGGHDAQPDVGVVHADPALREEHPVDRDQEAEDHGYLTPAEQDPGQEVEEHRHRDPGQDPGQTPGIRVLADVDRGDRPRGRKGEQLLPVGGRIALVDVEDQGRRTERQSGIRIDRSGVRFDHVHRRLARFGSTSEHVDHLGREVVGDPAGVRAGQDEGGVE